MKLKIANTKYPVLDLIKERWSPRSFSKKPISQTDLETILEAGSWAFSASNMQPWYYVYAHQNDASFQKLVDCLMPGNQPWAKNAAVLIACVINLKSSSGKDNRAAKHDLGAANATLMLQALSMNIYGHVMGGVDLEKANETLGLNTEEQEVMVFMALGYKDDAEKLEEPFKSRELTPRDRKSIEEFTLHFK